MEHSAFGYEQDDGKIHYALTKSYTLDEHFDYMNSRKIPQLSVVSYIAPSLEEFFCQTLFTKEKSNWRIVYLLDGTSLCRHCSKKGEIIYRH
jgi:hypothetical protein